MPDVSDVGGIHPYCTLLQHELFWKPEAHPIPECLAGRSASVSRNLSGSLTDFSESNHMQKIQCIWESGRGRAGRRQPQRKLPKQDAACNRLQWYGWMGFRSPLVFPLQPLQGFAGLGEAHPTVFGGGIGPMQPMLWSRSQGVLCICSFLFQYLHDCWWWGYNSDHL